MTLLVPYENPRETSDLTGDEGLAAIQPQGGHCQGSGSGGSCGPVTASTSRRGRQSVILQFIQTGKGCGGLGNKLANLRRVMAGLPLQGPKVGPFGAASRATVDAVAIDRRVAMILFGTRQPSAAQIRKGQEVAGQIMQRLGWDTRQVQAAWWSREGIVWGT